MLVHDMVLVLVVLVVFVVLVVLVVLVELVVQYNVVALIVLIYQGLHDP